MIPKFIIFFACGHPKYAEFNADFKSVEIIEEKKTVNCLKLLLVSSTEEDKLPFTLFCLKLFCFEISVKF